MVDRDDDIKIGVRSTAILFGDADRLLIGLMQVMVVIGLIIIGAELEFGWVYVISVIAVFLLFIWQQLLIRKRIPENCFRAFLNNNYVGLVIFIAILIEYLGK